MRKSLKNISTLCFLLFIASISDAKIPDTVLKQKKAVVTIYISDIDGNQVAAGSGFIIDPNGIITTNYHVISKWIEEPESTLIVKLENGAYFPIEELISIDEDNDVALFKVRGKALPTVKLANEYKLKQGESIVVIGSPLGLETTISDGIISNVREETKLIQITASVSPGSSGSPVFNSKGEVIGVATFMIEGGQNLNFATPVKYVADLFKKYKEQKGSHRFIFEDDLNLSKEKKKGFTPLPETPAPSPGYDKMKTLDEVKSEVKNNPDSAEAHKELGDAYTGLGLYEEAINAYKQAIRLKAEYEQAYRNLGWAYLRLGIILKEIEGNVEAAKKAYSESIEGYKQAIRLQTIRLSPDNNWFLADDYFNLGRAYFNLGMYSEAVEALKQSIRIRPKAVAPYHAIGMAYFRLDMYRDAIEAFKQGVRNKPDDAVFHYYLGITYLLLNDRGSALEEYKILKDLDPEKANELFKSIYE